MDMVTPKRKIRIDYSKSLSKGKLTYIARINKKIIARADTEKKLIEMVTELTSEKKAPNKKKYAKKKSSKKRSSTAKSKS